MRIDAHTPDELIELSGDKKHGLLIIDELISSAAPQLERWLLKSDTYAMLGYGRDSENPQYPVIAAAPQKNYISLYVEGERDGEPLTSYYKDRLGKVSAGKSCINIRNVDKIDLEELERLVLDCVEWNER